MPAATLRRLTSAEIEAILGDNTETLYIPLAEGLSARVEIQIIMEPAAPPPGERPTRRAPTARELHTIADALARRVYQFHPIED